MLPIDALAGIAELKRRNIVDVLNILLTEREGTQMPILSGWAWSNRLAGPDRVTTFAHTHRTETYKSKMIADLVTLLGSKYGYTQQNIAERLRDKGAAYHWKPQYELRDCGQLVPGRRIRDTKTGMYIDLEKLTEPTLAHYHQFDGRKWQWRLVCEESAEWQVDLPFSSITQLTDLAAVFDRAHMWHPNKWTGADSAPLIVIGSGALQYLQDKEIADRFVVAHRFYLEENDNEVYFIIGQREVQRFAVSPHHPTLAGLGLMGETCLVDVQFAKQQLGEP